MHGRDIGLRGRQPRAIVSALAILQLVAESGPVSAREISTAVGLSPATSYSILQLLVTEGYLKRVSDASGFAVGHRFDELTRAVTAADQRNEKEVNP